LTVPIIDNAPPPAKRGPGRPRKAVATAPNPKREEYAQSVQAIFTLGALITGMVGWHADSVTLAENAPTLAPAIADNALKNEALAKVLDSMNTVGGPWIELFVLSLPMTMQFLVNHKALQPSPSMGTVPEEVQRAKALAMRAAAQAEAQSQMDAALAQLQDQESVPAA